MLAVIRKGGRRHVVRILTSAGGKAKYFQTLNQIEAALRFWAAVSRSSSTPPEAHPAVKRMFKTRKPLTPDQIDRILLEPMFYEPPKKRSDRPRKSVKGGPSGGGGDAGIDCKIPGVFASRVPAPPRHKAATGVVRGLDDPPRTEED
jgi:hypothetical protein